MTRTLAALVAILMTMPAASQTVEVPTAEAWRQTDSDLEAVSADVEDHEARIATIEAWIAAFPDKPTDPTDPEEPTDPDEPAPPSEARIIGMNSGFVDRNDGRHPDNPDEDGYHDLIRPVNAAYRPMNWNRINDDLTQRDTIDGPHFYNEKTYREQLARQVEVCNESRADFYLNVPFYASDNWIREAVAYLKAELWDGATIYVSWSNENWNSGMATYQEIKRITGTDPGGGENAFFDYWAEQLSRVWKAAREADPDCIRVLESKTADDGTWFTDRVVRKLTSDFDAHAGTFYFAPHHSDYVAGITAQQLLDAAEKEWRDDDRKWHEANIQWANDRGLLALGYEAGQHYHAYGFESQTRKCQTDPRMADQYRMVYQNAIDKGADLIIDFEWVGWDDQHGHWGKASTLSGIPDSLKYQTIKEIAEQN